jgi:hypothetical protein
MGWHLWRNKNGFDTLATTAGHRPGLVPPLAEEEEDVPRKGRNIEESF